MHFLWFWTIIKCGFYVIQIFMKSLFMSLWKSILKHPKKLIYTILAFILGQICFFSLWWIWLENNVYAADSGATTQSSSSQELVSNIGEYMWIIQKIIYVFIFPLLVVAGKLVDNSFVYWEIFGFDVVLWKMWNIVRNLANFWLWFLFVYNIFSYLLTKKTDIKKILISALIAGIWIQASWFIMSTLLDMSTILAYSVWWLPISTLKNKIENSKWEEELKYNPYIFKNIIHFDGMNTDNIDKYLTNAGTYKDSDIFYISECDSFSAPMSGGNSIELLLAPKMIYYQDEYNTVIQTEPRTCHYYNQVYNFRELYTWNDRWECNSTGSCLESQWKYNAALINAKAELRTMNTNSLINLIDQAKILEIWDAHNWIVWWIWTKLYIGDLEPYWLDLYNEKTWTWKTMRLNNILDGSSYVWVFTALYTSLINSVWVIPPDAGLFASVLNIALSVGHMLAIGIPLIVVAIVFVIRIWILWVAIVISPFIILVTAFGLGDKVFKWQLEYFSITNLIPIIFSPAIICFAISISTVLVTIISGLNVDSIETVKTSILWWLIKLDIGWFTVSMWKLIVSLLWIAITWFLVWAAVESGKLWSLGVVKNLKGLASTALWSIPIVPIITKDTQWNPTTNFIWANSAFGLNGQDGIISNIMTKTKNKYANENQNVIDDLIDPSRVDKRIAESYKNAITKIAPTSDWTKQNITINWDKGSIDYNFDRVIPSKKQDIIDAINALGPDERSNFGNTKPQVEFVDWKWNKVVLKYEKTGKKEKKSDWTEIDEYKYK